MNAQSTRIGRQRLLEVAEKLFTQRGYQAVSIRDIASAAGVTNAAIYYYFPNKDALFDEVIEHYADKLAQRLQEAGAKSDSPRKQLTDMLYEYATNLPERRSLLFSLRRQTDGTHRKQLDRQHSRMVNRMLAPIEKTLNSAVEQGELRSLSNEYSQASLLLGLLHGMLQHRKNYSNSQIKAEDINLVIDIFWNGLSSKR
jgi:AcrR family transcriptional regulator